MRYMIFTQTQDLVDADSIECLMLTNNTAIMEDVVSDTDYVVYDSVDDSWTIMGVSSYRPPSTKYYVALDNFLQHGANNLDDIRLEPIECMNDWGCSDTTDWETDNEEGE